MCSITGNFLVKVGSTMNIKQRDDGRWECEVKDSSQRTVTLTADTKEALEDAARDLPYYWKVDHLTYERTASGTWAVGVYYDVYGTINRATVASNFAEIGVMASLWEAGVTESNSAGGIIFRSK